MIEFKDIVSSDYIEFEITPQLLDAKIDVGEVELIVGDEYKIIQNNQFIDIVIKNDSEKYEIDNRLKYSKSRLTHIIDVNDKIQVATIAIKLFSGNLLEMDDIEIGIDEKIEKSANRIGISFSTNEQLCNIFNDLVNINTGYFIITSGFSAKKDFEKDADGYSNKQSSTDINNENGDNDEIFEMEPEHKEETESTKLLSFMIYGDGFKMPVKRKEVNGKEIFFADRLIDNTNQKDDKSVQLAKGSVRFLDYTKTGEIQRIARGQMASLLESEDAYLKKWDEYGAIEGEMLLENAREVGLFGYHNSEIVDNGVRYFLNNGVPNGVRVGDSLEFVEVAPVYIENKDLTWEEFEKQLETEYKAKLELVAEVNEKDDSSVTKEKIKNHANIVEIDNDTVTLAMKAKPENNNLKFILSILGEEIQIKRRMLARESIKEGRSANPMLGPLIEDGGDLSGIERTDKIKPLTSFVKDKIFKHDPIPTQVEAIKVALNTPDMALIQGPPGTGKTTVITAIIERLNEEFDKAGKSIKGKILVTGFQHDAVENIVSRLSVNALPSVKFGRKSGSEFSENAVSIKIEKWCKNIAENIRSKNPELRETEDQLKLSELFNLYLIQPSDEYALNLLEKILALPRDILYDSNLIDKANLLKDSLEIETDNYLTNKLKVIRQLRVTEEGFFDDGAQRSADVMELCELNLTKPQIQILKKAIIWKKDKTFNFISQLKKIKKELLIRYTPKPFYRVNKPRADIIEFTAQVQKSLENSSASQNKKDKILATFLHELEDNPKGVEKALTAYNVVFAATVQQSEGRDIREAKAIGSEKPKLLEYDVVVVDEAARVSPRDLLIPMAQGKKIILVGDHRQLPHILNEAVVKKIDSDNADTEDITEIEVNYVKDSMFRYLFKRLKKIEAKDNIPRIVTLDAQFRMHPKLGQFVSEQFYPKGERFDSPLPAKLFKQSLSSIENHSAIWLDVPSVKGKEKKNASKSRLRVAEAKAIAKQLNEWINSEEGEKLTFGVISFYRGQVNAVYKELREYGITEKDSDGRWKIKEEYQTLKKSSEERIKIGTVDSFQGMEFDVVFLSIVRSQDEKFINKRLENNDDNKVAIGLFGHLMSENRLCVSMSRQKRVLVAVGDAEMFQMDIAKNKVPQIYNYLQLCHNDGIML